MGYASQSFMMPLYILSILYLTSLPHLGLATQLALAYAIHKSFIFVRVPLTAALTPKVVRVLRGWGWNIGKRTTKEARAINRAAKSAKKP